MADEKSRYDAEEAAGRASAMSNGSVAVTETLCDAHKHLGELPTDPNKVRHPELSRPFLSPALLADVWLGKCRDAGQRPCSVRKVAVRHLLV